MLTTTLTHSSTAPSTLRSVLLGCLISGAALLATVAQASAAILLSEYDDSVTNLVSGAPDGTPAGGVSMIAGKIGSAAMEFDGTSGYVNTGTAGFPNNTAGLTTGSTSFWIKRAGLSGSQEIILGGTNNGGNLNFQISTGKDLSNNNRTLMLYLRADGGAQFFDFGATSTAWLDGEWHHAALVWNATTGSGGTGTGTVYIDGAAQTTLYPINANSITSSNTFSAWDNPVRIGAGTRATTSAYFGGSLDDFSVWNGQLTDTEVLSIYNLGNDAVLNYNAFDADTLFGIFASQGSGVTTDGKTWQYVTGLTGTAGSVLNHDTLVLDGAGNGVQIVPEPSSLALLLVGALGLGLVRRKRA